jgi:drug/metabolite transporter (DMT)-like permease
MLAFVAALVRLAFLEGAVLEARHLPWVVLAGLGEAAYVYSLGMAYARGDLGLTYAVSRASALVFVWPLSVLVSGAPPTWVAVAATALVGVGILLTRPAPGGPTRWHLGWTLATGAAVAAYHTGYKGAVSTGATQTFAFVGALTLALPLLWWLAGAEVRAQVPALLKTPRMVVTGVLCAGSFLLLLEALVTADSGRILGVRNASVGFAMVLAVVRGERFTARQWAGVALLFVGVAGFGVEPVLTTR